MDRECVSLLPGVCEVLADSGRSLPDDTSLEKLLDWFTGLTEAGGSVLEAGPCLLEFVSAVVGNAASDPAVLSFTLKLTGLMAASEDGFEMLQEGSLLDLVFKPERWQEAGLWEDPCLRIGWILGLKNSLQHPKALGFFVKSDFIELLLQLQTDTSLFVAAAANQMLAHLLLFFQPAPTAGCNGADQKAGGRTQTSTIHADLLTAISDHLKESLVLKENAQPHQCMQALRLLAVLLAQAGPPLRDGLLHAVGDSLEELVAAGCSRLTLPLMDVILAAHSSGADERAPAQRVSRLLSSMLDADEPSDLIRAAAAFLHRGHHDTVHTARAVRRLLLPLHILTGQTLLGANATADEHRFSTEERLKSKTSCISLVCVCLTNTPRVTRMPPAVLPCPPGLIITAVLSVLKICSGISSPTGSNEVCRNIIGSGKVQKCALEAVTALSSSPGAKENISDVFAVLIKYLDNPNSDPTVLHKSYQALVKWTSMSTDLSFTSERLKQDLVEVVKKRVCDMRWEVRDSTVEFLGHLAGVPLKSEALLAGGCSIPLLKEALEDAESYVRASAVSALAKTLAHGWQQGAALTQAETDIVSRLLEILSQDTEGFSRRAVVRYFTAWFSTRPSSSLAASLLMQCVRAVLSRGSADLDWEVKVHTLELAELLLEEAFLGRWGDGKTSPHPYGVVSSTPLHAGSCTQGGEPSLAAAANKMVELGVFSALLSGLVDCDRPVGLKACQLLITLRETVCPLSAGAAGVSCELPGSGWGRDIRMILEVEKNSDGDGLRGAEGSADCAVQGEAAVVGVCEVLMSLDLDRRRDVLTQSSDHVHNSPLSLLQDILTVRAARTRSDTEPGQEVIVDCY